MCLACLDFQKDKIEFEEFTRNRREIGDDTVDHEVGYLEAIGIAIGRELDKIEEKI